MTKVLASFHPVPLRSWARRRLAVAACLSLLAGAAVPAAASADPPVWHVEGPHAEITLFGSVHLLSQDTHWQTPALMDDLARADAVWFEIPIDAPDREAAGRLALQKGLLPSGQSLSSLLPPEAAAHLDRLAAKLGMPPATIDHFQPWFAELTLSVLYFQAEGARATLGVEEELAQAAPISATRGAFETAAEQIGFFADAPQAEQITSLEETLREIEQDPDEFQRLSAAWADGDVGAIRREAVDKLKREAPVVYARLLVDRNRRFAAEIEKMARGAKRVFVVVGVGHLVGPDGVPALLRRDGLRVEGP